MIRNYYGPPILPQPSTRTQLLVTLPLFAGLCALVPEISLFDLTFIPLKTAMIVWTAFAMISFVVIIRLCRKYYSAFKALWFSLFYGYASAGLPLYIFMATNYYFANNKITPQTFKVISAEVGRFKNPPNVTVAYKGLNKEIYYDWGTPVDKYKTVTFPIKKGLWGFDVVYQEDINVGLLAQ